jgi:hypothetical protein
LGLSVGGHHNQVRLFNEIMCVDPRWYLKLVVVVHNFSECLNASLYRHVDVEDQNCDRGHWEKLGRQQGLIHNFDALINSDLPVLAEDSEGI